MGFLTGTLKGQSSGRGGFLGGGRQSQPRDRKQEELARLEQFAALSDTPEPPAILGALEKTVDIISRPTFTVAGFIDELWNEGGSVGDAFKRANRELFSGIGGLQGDKETFGGVMEDAGVPRGSFGSKIAPFLFNETGKGWKFEKGGAADIGARDVGGFAADVLVDPLTYLSFGSKRAVQTLIGNSNLRKHLAATVGDESAAKLLASGKVPFTQQGAKVLLEQAEPHMAKSVNRQYKKLVKSLAKGDEELIEQMFRRGELELPEGSDLFSIAAKLEEAIPKVQRIQKADPADVLREATKINLMATETAKAAAIGRMVETGTLLGHLDKGGVKFAGRTIPGLGRGRFLPLANRVSKITKELEQTTWGAQFVAGTKRLDTLFNNAKRAARNLPGYTVARASFRSTVASMDGQLGKSVEDLVPKSWAKETVRTVGGKEMPVSEYIIRHMNDPRKYPASQLPEVARESVEPIKRMWAEWQAQEVREGVKDFATAKAAGAPIMFKRGGKSLKDLSDTFNVRMGRRVAEGDGVTSWNELTNFKTLDEVEEFAAIMRKEGAVDFDLDPVLDLRELLLRRGQAHNRAISMSRFETEMLGKFGLSSETVARETFKRVMPELDWLIKEEIDQLARIGHSTGGLQTSLGAQRRHIGETQLALGSPVRKRPFKKAPGTPPRSGRQQNLFSFNDINDKSRVKIGDLLANAQGRVGTKGQKVSLAGLNPSEQSVYWLARIQNATSLDEIAELVATNKEVIEKAAPGLTEEIYERVGIRRMEYLNSFNEPMVMVAGSPMKGHAMPEAISEEMTRMSDQLFQDPEMNVMLKVFDMATNTFKLGVTGAWPAFVFRNHYNNIIQNFVDIGLAAFDPVKGLRAATLIAGKEGTLITKAGKRYTYSEIRQVARTMGVIPDDTNVLELTGDGRSLLDLISPKISEKARVPNNLIEHQARMVNFMSHMERGLDPVEAAARVNKVLFDYGDLSKFEREGLRRLFPFYTWVSKNVRLQAEQILTEPGRVSATLKAQAPNVGDTGPDRDMLPAYLQGDFMVKMHKGKDGKQVFLTGIDIPFGAAIDQIFGTPTRNALLQNLNSINPFMAGVIEHATGRDLFTGKSLEERQQIKAMGPVLDTMPKPIRDWLEFQKFVDKDTGEAKYDINGTKASLLFKGFFLSRFFGSAESFARTLNDDGLGSALLDFSTGAEFREFDLSERERAHVNARIRRLEGALKKRGVVREFKRVFAPEGGELKSKLPQKRKKRKGGFLSR